MSILEKLSKLARLIGGHGENAIDGAHVALVNFDPDTASEVEYQAKVAEIEKSAGHLAELANKVRDEDGDVTRVQGDLSIKKEAARTVQGQLTDAQAEVDDLQTRLNAGEDVAGALAAAKQHLAEVSAAFDEALDSVEQTSAQLLQEQAEADVAHQTLSAYEAYYRELAAKLKAYSRDVKAAKGEQSLAESRAALAKFQADEQKRLAALRQGISDGSSVADAIRARTRQIENDAEKDRIVADTLKVPASSGILAAAMAKAQGGGKSREERAAALL